ncbi:MAG: hypothetical protein Q9N68_05080 [Gammaproteobacteria bacterium]|nr:hypothetical protein [Gammaproteobacteria bacterium]
MGFWSSVGNAISSVCSAAVDVVSSVASSIGSSLAKAATNFLEIAGPYIGAISSIIRIIGVFLDVLTPNDKPEELGAKAMQAEKKPEDFDSNNDYIAYLSNDIALDTEKFNNATDGEKMAFTAVGSSITLKGIEEVKGFDIPLTTWLSLARLKLDKNTDAKEVNTILDTFKEDKLTDFSGYVEGKLDTNKELEVGDTLVNMYQELEPTLSKAEIEQKVIQMEKGTL